MTTKEQFFKLLLAAFPAQPEPARFFWREDRHDDDYEFRQDLLRLAGRQWTEIKIGDWTMVGRIGHTRELLEPATFLYYLPLLMLGAIDDPGYLDWALEAIVPLGRDRQPKSKWWMELLETISPDQIGILHDFLAFVRKNLLPVQETFVVTQEEVLTSEAEAFWDKLRASTTARTKR
ncbi:DUF6714 family protein [Bradyrhizobium sp. NAS96.2]|uniref:DUF6714 family protein n=1 Tax=Bradyrhizobium sp. NAS96.2 TaxID=1680160 RepID=UPI0011611EF3|nr:DUF6714 family protein [Bradyrhizobium sp. NAS96.2]